MEINQNIINARVTFRNSPIHILEKFTKDKLIRKRPENIRKTFQLVD